jgi:hypothetical protein
VRIDGSRSCQRVRFSFQSRAILRSEDFSFVEWLLFLGAFRYHLAHYALHGAVHDGLKLFCIFSVCIDLYDDSNEIAVLMNENSIELHFCLCFLGLHVTEIT